MSFACTSLFDHYCTDSQEEVFHVDDRLITQPSRVFV